MNPKRRERSEVYPIIASLYLGQFLGCSPRRVNPKRPTNHTELKRQKSDLGEDKAGRACGIEY